MIDLGPLFHNFLRCDDEFVVALGIPFLKILAYYVFLESTKNNKGSTKICQRSAKLKEDQARSTKGTLSINLRTAHAETNHETPSETNEGAAVPTLHGVFNNI
jgi:hypothetical protein